MEFGWTLLSHAVLQRNKDQVSDHCFSGKANGSGRLILRVRRDGQIVPGFASAEVGRAVEGKLTGRIAGLPVGGPYDLYFRLVDPDGKTAERLQIRDVLVGDLWILAGQSNMQGAGYLPGLTPKNLMLRNFYMDNRWDVSRDPLHNLAQAAAPAHGGDPNSRVKPDLRGVGPGMSFAQAMWEATGVPQGTIACAHGGTSMTQWSPELWELGGASLYGAMLERVRNLGGRVAGMLWYQGCDDTGGENSLAYEARLRAFLKAVRRDLGAPRLPIVVCQLASRVALYARDEAWSRIRFAQYEICRSAPHTQCVPTVDLPLDDGVHLSAKSQQILGGRMAQAMRRLLGDPDAPPAIEAVSARVTQDPASGNANVTVTFRGIVGKIVSDGQPSGFFTPKKGELTGEGCFKVELMGSRLVVHTQICAQSAEQYVLAYGAGARPYANLCDEAGRSLPCFVLPMKRKAENTTDMLRCCEVSDPVYGPEALASLQRPQAPEGLSWREARFVEFYLEHPQRVELSTPEKKVFYYRFRTDCPERMQVTVLAGADGAFALFCDGKEVMREFSTNPLLIDEFRSSVTLEKGVHEWVFALSSNTGHAYGVCLRLKRKEKGPLPQFLERLDADTEKVGAGGEKA